jgi:transposase-like protein
MGVEFIISDAHLGLQAAIQSTFMRALWQHCRVHFMREALKVKHTQTKEIAAKMMSSFEAQPKVEDREAHRRRAW